MLCSGPGFGVGDGAITALGVAASFVVATGLRVAVGCSTGVAVGLAVATGLRLAVGSSTGVAVGFAVATGLRVAAACSTGGAVGFIESAAVPAPLSWPGVAVGAPTAVS